MKKQSLICLDTLLIAVPLVVGSAIIMPFVAFDFAREIARERAKDRD